ncbi:MAG: hypothetical protein ACRC46_04010 [Thermoguttaceae bacterium]
MKRVLVVSLFALVVPVVSAADVRWRQPQEPQRATGKPPVIRTVQFATDAPLPDALPALQDPSSPVPFTPIAPPVSPTASDAPLPPELPTTFPSMVPSTDSSTPPSLSRFPTTISTRPARDASPACPDAPGFHPIRNISIDIRPDSANGLPKECPVPQNPYEARQRETTCFHWKASALATKGAYFEDVQLERYGHTICPVLQPVISGAKFFVGVPLIPYKAGVRLPNECFYTLGYYRVGDCAPYVVEPVPLSVRGGLFQAGAIVGGAAMFP